MANHGNGTGMDLRNLGRTLQATVVLILLMNITLANSQCQTDFVRLHNKCYFFSKEELPWMTAYYKCSEMDSTLLILRNKGLDNRFHRYLNKEYLIPSEWWMGAKYDWRQKSWKWAQSGEVLKYSRFANTGYNQDLKWNCAILDPTISYKRPRANNQVRWNSRKCTDSKKYICQKELGPTVAPTKEDLPQIAYPNSVKREQKLKSNGQPAYIVRPVRKKLKTDPSKPKYICPSKYKHVRGMCYKFSNDMASWNSAYYNCDEEYNATLAIIRDRKEDKALRRALKRFGANKEDRWIGGKYDWKYMAWKWARDGTIIQHQNYNPENLKWHCLVWSPSLNDKWTSDDCIDQKYYICQTKPTKIVSREKFHKPKKAF